MQKFNEWMSVRQMNEPMSVPGSYQFSGTFDLENLPSLVEDSQKIDIDEARKLIPSQYENQFGGMQELLAGKAITEENKEILWISNDQGVVYMFEKN